MYSYLAYITCVSTAKPYIRKKFTNDIDCYDYLYITTFVFTIFVLLMMIYANIFEDEEKSITKTINRYKNLTNNQMMMMVFLIIITLSSSIFLYKLESEYNTPFMHNAYLKIMSVLLLLFASYLALENDFNIYHLFGIFSISTGIYLLNCE
jgi:succinate dehydrogenase hydrophobic anchor subunit